MQHTLAPAPFFFYFLGLQFLALRPALLPIWFGGSCHSCNTPWHRCPSFSNLFISGYNPLHCNPPFFSNLVCRRSCRGCNTFSSCNTPSTGTVLFLFLLFYFIGLLHHNPWCCNTSCPLFSRLVCRRSCHGCINDVPFLSVAGLILRQYCIASTRSVRRSGPVRFFASKMGNRQPQLVA